jgi:hypothetical protein
MRHAEWKHDVAKQVRQQQKKFEAKGSEYYFDKTPCPSRRPLFVRWVYDPTGDGKHQSPPPVQMNVMA